MGNIAIIGYVAKTERLRSSVNGNPRFRVTVQDINDAHHTRVWNTQPDAGLGYGIENPSYRDRPHIFILNGRLNITMAHPLDDPNAFAWLASALDLDTETAATLARAHRVSMIWGEN